MFCFEMRNVLLPGVQEGLEDRGECLLELGVIEDGRLNTSTSEIVKATVLDPALFPTRVLPIQQMPCWRRVLSMAFWRESIKSFSNC